MVRHKANLISAICLAGFGIYVLFGAAKLSYTAEVDPGPGFFPYWIGLGLVVFALGLMVSTLSSVDAKTPPLPSHSWRATGRSLAGWLGLVVSIVLFPWLGFGLSFVLLTIFFIAGIDRRPLLLAAGVGIALAIAFHIIFVIALNVSLPAGPWGF
jgi:putative tricarboxylic transport membrane protein